MMAGVKPIYVTGHWNPDTDSIASAVGYAELKGGWTRATNTCRRGWGAERAAGDPGPRGCTKVLHRPDARPHSTLMRLL